MIKHGADFEELNSSPMVKFCRVGGGVGGVVLKLPGMVKFLGYVVVRFPNNNVVVAFNPG